MQRRLKLLLSAYACEPGKGSEPGTGWNWVCRAARFHDVWVITRANNRPAIDAALSREPITGAHFVYFDLPRWARFWKKGQRLIRLYYYLWQLGAYFVARRLHKELEFDFVHHVTICSYWLPSFVSLLPPPFVWGPVGGGESAPAAFWRCFGLRGAAYELLRGAARAAGRLDPFVRLTARRATVAFATNRETGAALQSLGCRKVSILSQVGLSKDDVDTLGAVPIRQTGPFRVLSAGRLLHWKGFSLGLQAFAAFARDVPDAEYWLIGAGPELTRLRRLALDLGVAHRVAFLGSVPRARVLDAIAGSDVLLHPSLHESGGWVCLESLAAGRPVICLDIGGPAAMITEETGVKVPALRPDQAIDGLARALTSLHRQPELRLRLGRAAQEYARREFLTGGDLWSELQSGCERLEQTCTA